MKNLITIIISSFILGTGIFIFVSLFKGQTDKNDYYTVLTSQGLSIVPANAKSPSLPVSSGLKGGQTAEPVFPTIKNPMPAIAKSSSNSAVAAPSNLNVTGNISGNLFTDNKKSSEFSTSAFGGGGVPALMAVGKKSLDHSNKGNTTNGIASAMGRTKLLDVELFSDRVEGDVLPPSESGDDDLFELSLNGSEFVLLFFLQLYVFLLILKRKYKSA